MGMHCVSFFAFRNIQCDRVFRHRLVSRVYRKIFPIAHKGWLTPTHQLCCMRHKPRMYPSIGSKLQACDTVYHFTFPLKALHLLTYRVYIPVTNHGEGIEEHVEHDEEPVRVGENQTALEENGDSYHRYEQESSAGQEPRAAEDRVTQTHHLHELSQPCLPGRERVNSVIPKKGLTVFLPRKG